MRGTVWIPDWPVVAALLSGQVEAHVPIAVHEQRIIAVNGLAYREGVRTGMRRRQAQALVPHLVLVRHDGTRDVQYFERVVRACEEHIAYLSVLEPGLITFLARGPLRTAGSVSALADNLIGDITQRTGLEARVGFGEGLLTSVLAARQGTHVRNARPFLDAHPVAALEYIAFSSQARARVRAFINAMEDLGIRRIGDLRSLDAQALVTRFGDIGKHVITLINGGDLDQAGESYPLQELTVERALDPPLTNLDQATFLAREMAEELSSYLTQRGVIAREISIQTRSESGKQRERKWALDVASAKDITDRVRWQLSAWISDGEGPESGIERIVVVAKAIAQAGLAQGTLWGSERANREAAVRAVSRIQSLLGDKSVLVPERVGGRHPLEAHSTRLWDAASTLPEHRDAPWPGTIPSPWPNLVKAKPEKITLCDAHGHECLVSALGTFYCQEQCDNPTPFELKIEGRAERIDSLAGPWLQAVGWWNPQTQERKAWLELVCDKRGYLIYREDRQWWMAGIYE
ncbi:protein ImuB [Trueperella bonasi]|uniref:Protein ImuB n=1 Tax=Trueperella bonasi TaxID=312286 RepID=A0ABT9NDR8_9ACTO|nr:DNA polymerase Y family protein [Trueperella bonasi]MDP9805537.1 protein ImuB [Trueperella bonasi]